MKFRHPLITSAVLLSLAVHAGLGWYWLAHWQQPEGKEGAPHDTEVAVQVTRVAAPPPAPPSSPLPPPLPVVSQQPTPASPAAPLTPVPRPAPAEVPAPVPEPQAEASVPVPARIEVESSPVPALREQYRARLLQHVESHKFYPAAARRLRLQGDVTVRLEVGCNGAVLATETRGDAALLERAADQALQRALPLPVPPSGVTCPVTVDYVMVYRLR